MKENLIALAWAIAIWFVLYPTLILIMTGE